MQIITMRLRYGITAVEVSVLRPALFHLWKQWFVKAVLALFFKMTAKEISCSRARHTQLKCVMDICLFYSEQKLSSQKGFCGWISMRQKNIYIHIHLKLLCLTKGRHTFSSHWKPWKPSSASPQCHKYRFWHTYTLPWVLIGGIST